MLLRPLIVFVPEALPIVLSALAPVPNEFVVFAPVATVLLPEEVNAPLTVVLRNCAVPPVCVMLFANAVVPLCVVEAFTTRALLPRLPMVVVEAPEVLMFVGPETVVVLAVLPMLVPVADVPVLILVTPSMLVVEAALPIATVPVLVPVLIFVLLFADALMLVRPVILFVGAVMLVDTPAVRL